MSKDVRGYYALLGVASNASATQIKSAYRNLAKELHPDSGNSNDDGARFRLVSEAYSILSDPESRAGYDSLSATSDESGTDERGSMDIEPIVCSVCGTVTAQPRYVVFRHVVSLLVTTIRTPVQGIYCSACARKAGLKATLVSATAGWWGFPWGPIYTIGEGFRNAFGGENIAASEEMLLWHNALAFASRGDGRVSFALAEKLRGANNRDIATNAVRLQDYLQSKGVKQPPSLKNPWAVDPLTVLLHIVMIATLPVIAGGLIYASDNNGPSSQSVYAPSPYSPPPTENGGLSTTPSQIIGGQGAANGATPPVPTCATLPGNGKVLAGRARLKGKGHVLEIQNGSGGDAIIKLRDANGGNKLVASFFAASNQTATMSGIPDGTYVIQYAFGTMLDADCRTFSAITSAGKFPDVETLRTEKSEDPFDGSVTVRRMKFGYTLYAVPSGNVRPETLDPSAFNAD
jgi:hypothetical protein